MLLRMIYTSKDDLYLFLSGNAFHLNPGFLLLVDVRKRNLPDQCFLQHTIQEDLDRLEDIEGQGVLVTKCLARS